MMLFNLEKTHLSLHPWIAGVYIQPKDFSEFPAAIAFRARPRLLVGTGWVSDCSCFDRLDHSRCLCLRLSFCTHRLGNCLCKLFLYLVHLLIYILIFFSTYLVTVLQLDGLVLFSKLHLTKSW